MCSPTQKLVVLGIGEQGPDESGHLVLTGAYAVGEGVAELSPVTLDPDDEVADQLVAHYRALQGEHPDWAEFRAAMVTERRLLARLPLTHTYGWVP